MDPAILATYNRPVPRYTSYPTAAQFGPAVGPAEHVAWLADLDGVSTALYFHVPFCRELCWYCACNTMAMRRHGTLDAYADALLSELERVANTAPGLVVDAIQWGGGTPGQLGADRLRRIGRRIDGLFDRKSDAEIAFEIDPRYCDAELAAALADLHVTRVSLGVQDFDPTVQLAINRPQSFADTSAAVERVRGCGIAQINVDLVYGLPHQTLDSLARTLDQAVALSPARFAVFGYAHVPWMKPHQRLIDESALPDLALRAQMVELVADKLVAAGYVRIGLDHYARPEDPMARAAADGSLHRNFQGYVANEAPWVVGIGASAISSLPRGFSQNTADASGYMAAISSGSLATARGLAVTEDDKLRADIIQRLMCQHSVDLEECCRSHHVDPGAFLAGIDQLETLERDGLVRSDGLRLAVTEAGRPLVRFVCAAFDRHLAGGPGRHASGV
ncbi:oxygen-independent coproporphyrinogen-3 oxidase [Enhydrobacter aerosaccus]|uniref:Coproporphyrinogen-III oxidase n=1 Tax=Enhydrobacter aerosaccus TaxID=225324 RepID=A0A1T4R175_9HYPH|nr:oxygen-independent coproporphyrinogen III oxidase [Enhydrobacter aerosaccus]SKA09637.1 oxygen-independent coproporphyrinogen-3 oxidase [Enhydrobacter aerosaccus]